MAQDYYYNGTKLNDWDGTKGVIVSTFQHDSAPETANGTVDVGGGPGRVLRSSWQRAKTISVTGSVHGTDQADFEQRLDSLKALLAVPHGQLTVTNYGTTDYRVACFEEGEAWARTYVNDASTDDGALWDFTNYKIGRRGLRVEAVTGAPKYGLLTRTFDLSGFADTDTIKLWAYIADTTKLTSIALAFVTSGGNEYSKTWTSGFANGWNELTVLRSGLTTTGSPSWLNITSVQLTVTGSAATPAVVTFDDLRITSQTDSRTYEATVDGPVEIPRDHYHSTWVPFSVTFTVPDGRGRSDQYAAVHTPGITTDQQHVPLYLAGSGPQPVALTSTVGSTTPSEVQVYDHYADEFGSYVGRYQTQVATMEATESWTGGSADTTDYKFGTRGRKVTVSGAGTGSAYVTFGGAQDYSALANTELLRCWVKLDTAANVTNIKLRLYTTYATDYYEGTVTTGLANGWNVIEVQKKSLVGTGTPSWASITVAELEVTTSDTVNATFDDLLWVNTLGCTGGTLVLATTGDSAWEVQPVSAYRHALVQAGTYGTALLRGTAIRDGEVLALLRTPSGAGGTIGLIARADSATSPVDIISFTVAPSPTSSSTTSVLALTDSQTFATTTNFVTSTPASPSSIDWVWFRLVVKGGLVQGYYRDVGSDEWTKAVEGSTRHLAAGSWGVYANGRTEVAHLEVIDYAQDRSHALRLLGGPFGTTAYEGVFAIDTATLQAREGPLPGTVLGSFPAFAAGFNDAAVIQPSAAIGTARFRYVPQDSFSWWWGFGNVSNTKVGIRFVTGSQTYIRRRGTFVYLAKSSYALPTADLTARIETESSSAPSGTLVDSNATATVTHDDLVAQVGPGQLLSPLWNGSLEPIEIVWPFDLPVSASTAYWLVLQPNTPHASELQWNTPAQAHTPPYTGDHTIKYYTGAAWAELGADDYSGFVLLAGNYPNATISTPWTVTHAHTPRFH